MASTLYFTVNSLPALDEEFYVDVTIDASTIQTLRETFKLTRRLIGQSAIGTSVAECTNNLYTAIMADYNSYGLYTITYNFVAGTITVTANNPSVEFAVTSNTTGGAVTVSVTNDATDAISVTSVTGAEAFSDPCDNVLLTVTTNVQADNITSPISSPIFANPFDITVARSPTNMYLVANLGSTTATYPFRCPPLVASYFDIDITNNPTGAGVSVQSLSIMSAGAGPLLLTLEYSLDNVLWQTGNSWSGLAADDYTVYIRDGLGCQISIDFTVEAFNPNYIDYDPIADISKINPFAFKKAETISDCGTQLNPLNTLSYEENTLLNNKTFKQIFQTCDNISTQLKTNYDTVTANLIDCDATETPITVIKKTDNMGKTDVRDCKIYLSAGSSVWIYFTVGNTYDPDTLIANGSYDTGGNLPTFINEGDAVSLEGFGWVTILEVFPSTPGLTSTARAKTSLEDIDGIYTNGQTIKLTSVYNVVNYERYEFDLDMSALLGDYYIQVDLTHVEFAACTLVSEWFNVKAQQPKHHLIEYYNSENNEINFGTGITFKLRIPYIKQMTFQPATEKDTYITDTQTVSLESRGREQYAITFFPMPTIMARKIAAVMEQDKLMIGGLLYVTEEETSINRLGSTNLYSVEAVIIRSDYVFETQTGTSLDEILAIESAFLELDENSSGLLKID